MPRKKGTKTVKTSVGSTTELTRITSEIAKAVAAGNIALAKAYAFRLQSELDFAALGVVKHAAPASDGAVKRGRGRPPKAKPATSESATPKKRGRPRKNPLTPATPATGTGKKRGRPRIKPLVDASAVPAVPKKRGRPRKNPVEGATPAVNAPKRGRGRPKKIAVDGAAPTVTTPKKRGRPRIKPLVDATGAPAAPKKRGRPAKPKPEGAAVPKKKRGRPAKSAAVKKAGGSRRGRPPKNPSPSAPAPLPSHSQKDYYRPLLEVLRDHGGSLSTAEAMMKVRERMEPNFLPGDTEPVAGQGMARWAYLLPWARHRLVKAGLMLKGERNMWIISQHGTDWLNGKLDLSIQQIDKLKDVPGEVK